jgi:hypothetical protein
VHELLGGGDHLDVDLVIRSHVVDAHGIRLAFDPQMCNDAYTRERQEAKV